MFEVGQSYNIVTLETGENFEGQFGTYEVSNVYEVASVEGTLIKLLGGYSEADERFFPGKLDHTTPRSITILNTSSAFFLRAVQIMRPVPGFEFD